MAAQKFLKLWLGVPARGRTSARVFSPYLLGVKPVSQVYLEGHLGAYVNSKLVADKDTLEALKCTEVREGQWSHKSSTTVQCTQLMEVMGEEQECFIPTEENTDTFEATVRVELPGIKTHTGTLAKDLAEGDDSIKTRLLHPQHLNGILTGLTLYRVPLDPLSEYPEPWS